MNRWTHTFSPAESWTSRRLYPLAAPFIIHGYKRMEQVKMPLELASASVSCSKSSWTADATWLHANALWHTKLTYWFLTTKCTMGKWRGANKIWKAAIWQIAKNCSLKHPRRHPDPNLGDRAHTGILRSRSRAWSTKAPSVSLKSQFGAADDINSCRSTTCSKIEFLTACQRQKPKTNQLSNT